MLDPVLTDDEVERFVTDGAIRLDAAFPRDVADECRRLLWSATGCDEHDPTTWTRPVVRIAHRDDDAFRAAASTARLYAAFDQLAGTGRWLPLSGLGTFPIRFPTLAAPDDDGWHIEATGSTAHGEAVVDPASSARVLLLLFLFSDVGVDDAPTRVRVGSHGDAARLLGGADGPIGFVDAAQALASTTEHLPTVSATGRAGDVWLCHPYLVHAAQRHRGKRVRFMAQPPLAGTGPVDPTRPSDARSAVEEAVRRALGG